MTRAGVVAGVERRDVLAPRGGVDPADGEHAARREPDDRRARRERRMRVAQRGERLRWLRDRVRGDVERRAGADRRRADPLLRPPLGAPASGTGPAAPPCRRRCRRSRPRRRSRRPARRAAGRAGLWPSRTRRSSSSPLLPPRAVLDHPRRAAHVVVAEERRRRGRDAVGRGSSRRRRAAATIPRAPASPAAKRGPRPGAGSRARSAAAVAHERRELDRVGDEDLAEELEVGHAGGARGGQDPRHPDPEERLVTCRAVSIRKPSTL